MKAQPPKRKLTRKQKAFADIILANPLITGKEAAQQTYNVTTDSSAEVVASENLRKPQIMEYLADNAKEAEQTMVQVMNYSKLNGMDNPAYAGVAVAAAKDILDRVHGKATQRIESTSKKLEVHIDLTA